MTSQPAGESRRRDAVLVAGWGALTRVLRGVALGLAGGLVAGATNFVVMGVLVAEDWWGIPTFVLSPPSLALAVAIVGSAVRPASWRSRAGAFLASVGLGAALFALGTGSWWKIQVGPAGWGTALVASRAGSYVHFLARGQRGS